MIFSETETILKLKFEDFYHRLLEACKDREEQATVERQRDLMYLSLVQDPLTRLVLDSMMGQFKLP